MITEVFKVFHPEQSSTASVLEQIVDIPVRSGAFTILSLILGRQPHPQCHVMWILKGFFALFSVRKKCEVWSSSARVHGLELMDAGGL